ncbi:hypothetical protein [Streptomyces sp. BPTC-684]|uniref:hypothetical protein n=1 Tax=Streptomyces sp. BPTC-684 TaxID=3043734 RepID=UPI0024B095E2|nr:hypothetical protein [Streptomyces sp. BPTC-684]WHM35579.1 hypothetical protein QIY60_00765 [Streptomyces sp. BPTC-684]
MTAIEERGTTARATGEPAARERLRRFLLPLLIAALVAVSGVLLLLAGQAKHSPAAANRALTDRTATDEVLDEVGAAVSRVFSYGPQTLTRTRADAHALLRGQAAKEYEALFAQVQQRVTEQELTLTTRVARAGVARLTGTRAELLLFLDQTSVRRGAKATTVAAQLSVTAGRDGGRWRITAIEAR